MSSEKFENLEDDFKSIKDSLSLKINEFIPKSSGQSRNNQIRDAQRELENAWCLLDELEIEAQRAPHPFRMQMNTKIKGYRQDLNALKKKMAKIPQNESNFANRNQLLGATSASGSGSQTAVNIYAGNRGRLMQMNETIERTSGSVNRTLQIAAETDQVGTAVVDELGTQREALIRTKERLVDTDANLTMSRKILRSMYRRVITDKLILVLIIILEIFILGGVVYYKFFRK